MGAVVILTCSWDDMELVLGCVVSGMELGQGWCRILSRD